MRIVRLTIILLAGFFAGPTGWAESAASVRLLTIGNSFAENAVKYLPQFARAAGRELHIFEANLSSHSLEQHWRYVQRYEADPLDLAGRPYKGAAGQPEARSLAEVLASEPWDYITLQQVSHLSYKEESFQPWLGELVAYLRRCAPRAEILLHETWAYREDHPLYREGFSIHDMAARIAANYRKLADAYQLRVLPVGSAFQAVRVAEGWRFTFPDPAFDYAQPAPGALPRQPGSLNRGWTWRKNRTTGADELRLDAIHANAAGCYLAGAVWFEMLFGEDGTGNPFRPPELSAADAAFLRQTAHQAVASPTR